MVKGGLGAEVGGVEGQRARMCVCVGVLHLQRCLKKAVHHRRRLGETGERAELALLEKTSESRASAARMVKGGLAAEQNRKHHTKRPDVGRAQLGT